MFKNYKEESGFTLLEILLVVALIAVLAGLILVALKPAQRIQQTNDTQRQADTASILSAVYQYTIDNVGALPVTLTAPTVYGIGTEAGDCSVAGGTYTCTSQAVDAACVDLTTVVTDGYLSAIPVNPGVGGSSYSDAFTGYYITQATNGTLLVGSCDQDYNGNDIISQR